MTYISELNWHVTPFRSQRWIDNWEPAAQLATEYGAVSWEIYRSDEDPLLFRQVTRWDKKSDFEAWWYSPEVSEIRASVVDLYDKPLLPVWCSRVVASD
ncbi:MAG: antibiotic biosynthesis monooxygenase [Solirubrobacterales bacterium]|nr:antibiotic biosynthesis monooxygenase [Solirubrobacterales bacterium]